MRLLKQSSTAQALQFFITQSADHITGLTGASPTVTLHKSNASAAGSFGSPAGTVRELGSGWYQVDGNATDTGTLGPLILHATAGSGDPTDVEYTIVAFDPQVATNLGLSALPTATAAAAGGLMVTGASNAGSTTFAGAMVLASTLTVSGLTTLTGITHGASTFSGVTLGAVSAGVATITGVNASGGATFAGTVAMNGGAGAALTLTSSAQAPVQISAPLDGTCISITTTGAGHGVSFSMGTGNGINYTGSGNTFGGTRPPVTAGISNSATSFAGIMTSSFNNTGASTFAGAITATSTSNTWAGTLANVGTISSYTGNTVQTGDSYARLGAPVHASISADIAAVSGGGGGGTENTYVADVVVTISDN